MFTVISIGDSGQTIGHAIMETWAEAARWQLANGRRADTEIFEDSFKIDFMFEVGYTDPITGLTFDGENWRE